MSPADEQLFPATPPQQFDQLPDGMIADIISGTYADASGHQHSRVQQGR